MMIFLVLSIIKQEYSTVQYSTVQYSTVQYSTYSAVQHKKNNQIKNSSKIYIFSKDDKKIFKRVIDCVMSSVEAAYDNLTQSGAPKASPDTIATCK